MRQPAGDNLPKPERTQKIVVFSLACLLAAFAVWCVILFWRAHTLRSDLDFQLGSVEDVRRLHSELDRLRLSDTQATEDSNYELIHLASERLTRHRGGPEMRVAVQSLNRTLERLRKLLNDGSSPDAVWEATVSARSAVTALESRIQTQVSELHRRLGGLWAALNLLIVASLVLAASNLALLRLAHRRRLRLEQAHQKALLQSTLDPLTHLWNREAILKLLRRELARAERLKSPLGVILLDIDGFQQVNVLLGQDQGDFILEQLAERLGAFVRPYDTMGRFGGDSFLIVLPVCDETATGNVADRLREAVNEREVEHAVGKIGITVSLVYATVEEPEEIDADLLIHRLQERIEQQQMRNPGQVTRLARS